MKTETNAVHPARANPAYTHHVESQEGDEWEDEAGLLLWDGYERPVG